MTLTKRSERGFTVVELLTVIAIMMVITAIATPSFYYWLPKYRLSAGARQIAADLQLARMKAISQNISYGLRFIDNNTYQVWRDKSPWEQDPATGDFDLPEGITVTIPNVPPAFDTSEFQSRGTANTGVGISQIEITNGDLNKAVCIKLVGRVHIEESVADC